MLWESVRDSYDLHQMTVCGSSSEFRNTDLKPKPELGIQFGAGGDTKAADLESIGTSNPSLVIKMEKRFVDVSVERTITESEWITENVKTWWTDIIQVTLGGLPMDKVMFEAADPKVLV